VAEGIGNIVANPEINDPDGKGIVAHCSLCRCDRLFVKQRTRHLRHLLATALTGGLWLVPWIAICIEGAIRPWRCEACGWHKPEFRIPLKDALKMGESAVMRKNLRKDLKETRRIPVPGVELPGGVEIGGNN
jgi:hypothetical protein